MNKVLQEFENSHLDPYSQIYEVIMTVVLVVGRKPYRIEVYENYSYPRIPFTTRCWVQEEISKGKVGWVRHELPWIARQTADAALRETLEFLSGPAES